MDNGQFFDAKGKVNPSKEPEASGATPKVVVRATRRRFAEDMRMTSDHGDPEPDDHADPVTSAVCKALVAGGCATLFLSLLQGFGGLGWSWGWVTAPVWLTATVLGAAWVMAVMWQVAPAYVASTTFLDAAKLDRRTD